MQIAFHNPSRIVKTAVFITVSLLILESLYFIWGVREELATNARNSLQNNIPNTSTSAPVAISLHNLPNLNLLFGVPSVETENRAVIEQTKETSLQLELIATWKNTQQNQSKALIKSGRNAPKLYYIDQSILNQATLAQVEDTGVLISRNGKIESLKFPKPSLSSISKIISPLVLNEQNNQTPPVSPVNENPDLSNNNVAPSTPIPPGGEGIFNVINNLNPEALLGNVGISSDGLIKGDHPLLKSYFPELQSGDKIISINGQPLQNVLKDPKTMFLIAMSGKISAQVNRNGKIFRLSGTLPIGNLPGK